MRLLGLPLALGVLWVVALAACRSSAIGPGDGSAAMDPMGDAGLLAPCTGYESCASNLCIRTSDGGYCSTGCATDTDCPSGTACDGACKFLCTADSPCTDCACTAGNRCVDGTGCVLKSAVGVSCSQDSDCASDNCAEYARVCDVPVGSPCDATNCQLCLTWVSGFSYCSRSCSAPEDCKGTGTCATSGETYQCDPPCQASCEQDCEPIYNASGEICPCVKGCTATSQPGAVGAPCDLGTNCESGSCVSYADNVGICSQTCTDDASCGAGAACVTCGPGCGNQCYLTCGENAPPCLVGTCNLGTDASGDAVRFCDPHLPTGGTCGVGSDCISGSCCDNVCC